MKVFPRHAFAVRVAAAFLGFSPAFFGAADPKSDSGFIGDPLDSGPSAAPPRKERTATWTDSEREWLAASPSPRIGVDPRYPPFAFLDESGKVNGMARDWVRTFNAKSPARLRIMPGLTRRQIDDRLRAGKLDAAFVANDFSETKGRRFLKVPPFAVFAVSAIARKDASPLKRLSDLSGKTVALVRNSPFTQAVLPELKTANVVFFSSPPNALTAVSEGAADVAIETAETFHFFARRLAIENLTVALTLPNKTVETRLAVRDDDAAALESILTKISLAVPAKEKEKIYRKWVETEEETVDLSDVRRMAWQVGSVAALALLAFGLWNWRLSRENAARKKIAEALMKSEQLSLETQRVAKLGGWELDLGSRKWTCSDEFRRLLELENACQANVRNALRRVDKRELPRVTSAIRECLRDGKAFDLETTLITARNGRIWGRLVGRALRVNNVTRKIYGTLHDITDRKRAEEAREDIERVIRHDLKTPLGLIIGVRELFTGVCLDEDHQRYLELVEKSGKQMLELIDFSLNLHKIEQQTYILKPTPVDLVPMLSRIFQELEHLAARKRRGFHMTLDNRELFPGEKYVVYGEETLCAPLFANLLKNAVEASPENARIEVCLSTRDPETRKIVIANLGVPPREIRAHFFDKYVTAGKQGGTGLGTYSARLMTRAQNGHIGLFVENERQTLIAVTLPAPPV